LPLGDLDPALLGDTRLCWCTGSEMRRLRAAGAVAAVVPAAAAVVRRTSGIAAHLADPGMPLVLGLDDGTPAAAPGLPPAALTLVVAGGDDVDRRVAVTGGRPDAVAGHVVASLGALAAAAGPAPPPRIAVSEAVASAISAALSGLGRAVALHPAASAPRRPWAVDAWIAHLQGTAADAEIAGAAVRHPAVVWIDDAGASADAERALRRARAAVVASAGAARRLPLDRGMDAPRLRVAVADPDDPEGAARSILALVDGLGVGSP
ncbi:MAG TPA: hypothetical protein VFO60_08080, partial [Candidatus Dormibacteraeota bacterium]|nr:hypothetical protein [Candidatus Dormibacteraeota bacterium]